MQIFIDNPAVFEDVFSGTTSSGIGQSEDFLQPGQIVEATVIFAANETANVKLTNGAVLRARLADGVTLTQGDTVWLSIKVNDGKSLQLQIMANSASARAPNQTPAEMLSKAGLQQTPLNLSLAAALKTSGLPLETKWVEQAAAILKQYPTVGMETAVFAAASNIKANPANLAAIEAALRPDFKAGDMLVRIFSQLNDRSAFSNIEPNGMITPAPASIHPGNVSGEVIGPAAQSSALASVETALSPAQPAAPEQLDGGGSNPAVSETIAGTIKEGTGAMLSSVPENNPYEGSPSVSDKSMDLEMLFKNATGVGDKQGQQLAKTAERMFFAGIDKPGDAKALKQAGEQLLNRLQIFKSHAQSNGYIATSTASEIDKLVEGLRLLQDVERYHYMQMPVLTSGRPSTAELYVFSKKRGAKKHKPNSTTILLALDTENLGHIEALVNIRKSSISIRFSVSNEEIADFLVGRTAALYNMVSGSGYQLSGISFQMGAQPVTPLTALKMAEQDIEPRHQKINIRI